MTIGELWDLKELGEHCAKTGTYEFLLTSAPLNVPGGGCFTTQCPGHFLNGMSTQENEIFEICSQNHSEIIHEKTLHK